MLNFIFRFHVSSQINTSSIQDGSGNTLFTLDIRFNRAIGR